MRSYKKCKFRKTRKTKNTEAGWVFPKKMSRKNN